MSKRGFGQRATSDRALRRAAVAGHFYPADPQELRRLVQGYLSEAAAAPAGVRGAVVPHAGLVYSGACAAQVFARIAIPDVVVILAPNHTGRLGAPGGASLFQCGAFETPLGAVAVADEFAARLAARCPLVSHDPAAHALEHAIEVELPLLRLRAPQAAIVPLVLAWDDWPRCRELAAALAEVAAAWPDAVLLVASSDMTHYEPADRAAQKDRVALEAVCRLDGEGLLAACRRHGISMCGRAPAATVLEATRRLGAERAEVVDYRHSGWVTGDHSSVVAYAGVIIP